MSKHLFCLLAVACGCVIGAHKLSGVEPVSAAGDELWSRGFLGTPSSGPFRPFNVVLIESVSGNHLVATCIYANYSNGKDSPPLVTIQGVKTEDGKFQPHVFAKVTNDVNGEWTTIEELGVLGQPTTRSVAGNTVDDSLTISLEVFRPLIEKFVYGSLVLPSGEAAVFELKDLLPPKGEGQDVGLSTKTVEAQPEHIQELNDPEPLQQQISHRPAASDDSAKPEEQAAFSGSRGSFVLFSWKDKGGDYKFALVPMGKEAGFLKTFHPRRIGLRGLINLKIALEQLSAGTSIVWEDDQVKGLTYPSINHIDQITMFARSKGLRIELNPVVVE